MALFPTGAISDADYLLIRAQEEVIKADQANRGAGEAQHRALASAYLDRLFTGPEQASTGYTEPLDIESERSVFAQFCTKLLGEADRYEDDGMRDLIKALDQVS